MKSLIFLLSFLVLSSSAFASSGYNVKVSDGKTAHCKTKADVTKNKFGSYTAKLKSIVVDRDIVSTKISIKFLSCVEKDGKFGFTSVSAYSPMTYETVTFNSGKRVITAETELVKMLAFKDGIYKKIADITLEDETDQTVNLNIKIGDLLSAEAQEALDAGETVLGNFDYALQKFITIEGVKDIKPINFGAFRIHFKAVLDQNNNYKFIAL